MGSDLFNFDLVMLLCRRQGGVSGSKGRTSARGSKTFIRTLRERRKEGAGL